MIRMETGKVNLSKADGSGIIDCCFPRGYPPEEDKEEEK